jgi:hypothetical protein
VYHLPASDVLGKVLSIIYTLGIQMLVAHGEMLLHRVKCINYDTNTKLNYSEQEGREKKESKRGKEREREENNGWHGDID